MNKLSKKETLMERVKRFMPENAGNFSMEELAEMLLDEEFRKEWVRMSKEIKESKEKDLTPEDKSFLRFQEKHLEEWSNLNHVKNMLDNARKKGVKSLNKAKRSKALERQQKIKTYLKNNTPDLKGKSLEYHLIDTLGLTVGAKTISRDLAKITLDKR